MGGWTRRGALSYFSRDDWEGGFEGGEIRDGDAGGAFAGPVEQAGEERLRAELDEEFAAFFVTRYSMVSVSRRCR